MDELLQIKGTVKYNKEEDYWYIVDENGSSNGAGNLLEGIDNLDLDFRAQHNDVIEITVKRKSVPVTNTEAVIKFLSNKPYCDDCISEELDIKPRQAINQICRKLSETKAIQRVKGSCSSCARDKIVNMSV